MRIVLLSLAFAVGLEAYRPAPQPVTPAQRSAATAAAADSGFHPSWSRNAVIYEVNVRQYTPEGTLGALQRHLPRLKDLGVDILWLMPVQPIGEKEPQRDTRQLLRHRRLHRDQPRVRDRGGLQNHS